MPTFAKRAYSALAGAALLAGGLASPGFAEPRELIFDVFIPARAQLHADGMVGFAKDVEDLSGGTLKLTIPTAPMAPPPRVFDIVEDGVADVALVAVIYRGNQITLPSITDIFGLAETATQGSIALWRTHEKFFDAADEWGNIVPITIFTHGEEQFFVKDDAINSVADMENLKFIAPSKLHASRIQSLGGVPVGAPQMKMFELVSGGVADGVITPAGPANVQGLPGVAENVTIVPGGISRPAFAVIMNRDVFESLTDAQQAAIMEAGGEKLAVKLGGIADQENELGVQTFRNNGAAVVDASPEMIAEIGEKLHFIEEEWLEKAAAAGIDGPAALAYFKEVIAELGGS